MSFWITLGLIVFFGGFAVVGSVAYEVMAGKPDIRFLGFSAQTLGTWVGVSLIGVGFAVSLIAIFGPAIGPWLQKLLISIRAFFG